MPVNINVKTRIRYKGQEYSDISQLPVEVRSACEKAMAEGAVRKKILLNGDEVSERDPNSRKLYEDLMTLVENQTTAQLPAPAQVEPLLTKRQLQVILLLIAIVLIVCWAIAK